jgi:hypothetical protein
MRLLQGIRECMDKCGQRWLRVEARVWLRDVLKRLVRPSLDIKIAMALFLLASVVGMGFVSSWSGIPIFYQRGLFGPAVMWACGRGFENPVISQVPALADFLGLRAAAFSCDALPTDVRVGGLNYLQHLELYLVWAAALLWKVLGTSWKALTPLYGVLFGCVVSFAYGLFRLGMRRSLAVVCALLLAFSVMHLTNLPHLRDYSKAPFTMGLTLIMGCIVQWPLRRWTLFGLSAAYGVLLGLGLGFRTDLLICVLPFPIILFFFVPGPVLANLRIKTVTLILFLVCFLIIGWPIISSFGQSGSTLVAQAVAGSFGPFDAALGVNNPLYDRGYMYHDVYREVVLQSYLYRELGVFEYSQGGTPGFEQASNGYLLEIIKAFPADILIRAYASILKILELPFSFSARMRGIDGPYPVFIRVEETGITHPLIRLFCSWREGLMTLLFGMGAWVVAAALVLVSRRSLRKAIFLAFLLVYFAGYPALQFQTRHYFHLEFISLWAVGFVAEQAVQATSRVLRDEERRALWATLRQPRRWWSASVRRSLGFAVVVLVLILGVLSVARWYQQEKLEELFTAYTHLEKEPLKFVIEPQQNQMNQLSLRIVDLPRQSSEVSLLTQRPELAVTMATEYLVMQFDPRQCDQSAVNVTFEYGHDPSYDPSFTTSVVFDPLSQSDEDEYQVFSPIYEMHLRDGEMHDSHGRFVGLRMSQADEACVSGLYRVKDPYRSPLLLTLILPPAWEQASLYETLTDWPISPVDAFLTTHLPLSTFRINQLIGKWTLLGYKVDESQLARGESVDLTLYWLSPPDVEPTPEDGFYRDAGNRWVQVIHQVQNLILDGGFESGDAISSFPYDIYDAAPETRQFTLDTRDGQPTVVATLNNSQDATRSSFASVPIGVRPDRLYLQAGWLRSEAGRGYLGREWLPGGQYDYAVCEANPTTWTHYAQVVQPPAGATQAQVWLLNYESEGQVYFDDVVFVELGQVTDAACQPAEPGSPRHCGPPLLTGARVAAPTVPINQTIGEWELLGYEVDESRLARDEPVDLRLYWWVPSNVEPISTDDFYRDAGNRWVQVIYRVPNLIPDGGFEGGAASSFFPYDIYEAAPEIRQVVLDTRDGQPTIVATLNNSQDATQSSFASVPVGVRPDRLYLQAGWLRSEAGRGYLGREWLPGGQYDYAVCEANPTTWTHYAQVVQPPAGATQAQIWLLNYESEGQVYFDDMVFVELGQVTDAACQPAEPGSPRRCGPPLLVKRP